MLSTLCIWYQKFIAHEKFVLWNIFGRNFNLSIKSVLKSLGFQIDIFQEISENADKNLIKLDMRDRISWRRFPPSFNVAAMISRIILVLNIKLKAVAPFCLHILCFSLGLPRLIINRKRNWNKLPQLVSGNFSKRRKSLHSRKRKYHLSAWNFNEGNI